MSLHYVTKLVSALLAPLLILSLAVAVVPVARGAGPSGAQTPDDGSARSGTRLDVVGQLRLGGGVQANLWAYQNFAYVGTWSRGCPGAGVKVIDIADPAAPFQVASLASYPASSAENMIAIDARTSAFQGDLMAVGLQSCAPGGPVGVDFWDVTDPAQPQWLGYLATPRTGGVHELHLFQRDGRIFALLAVPYSEYTTDQGDFRIVEATDPRHPVQVSDWGAFRDLGVSESLARGQDPYIYAHSPNISPDGRTAYVSYWDAGLMILDISDPATPRLIGRITDPRSQEGNTHSSYPSPDGRLLAVGDEVFDSGGYLRLYDLSDPANPVPLSIFSTPRTRGENDPDWGPPVHGWYTAHNPVFAGNRLFVSWFSDGVRVLDVSDPSRPREIASFVPPDPPAPPGRAVAIPVRTLVWGVFVRGDLVLASDMNYGLYILRLVETRP